MRTAADRKVRDLIVVADPCGQPNPRLVIAAARAGALGLLDLTGRQVDGSAVEADIARVVQGTGEPFGLRVPHGGARAAGRGNRQRRRLSGPRVDIDVPGQVDTIVLAGPLPATAPRPGWAKAWDGRRVLVEVVSLAEARAALDAGAAGLIAKGCESGGRVGTVEGFVLVQQVAGLCAERGVPFWLQGGFGLHTAAAAIVAGAAGVVVDGQLALVRESGLDDGARLAVGAMDGAETRVVGGHRIYVRPDLPAATVPPDTDPQTVADRLGTDLRRDLVPLGQDATVAAGLARRYATTGGVIQALRAAIDGHLAAAAARRPLAPGAGVAGSHGLRYPIAQGPMTRVSDRAELAAAVAGAGALPFLALALMTGDETRRLLTEAAELLGERAWGVGILGFVPPDVRAAQLEVIEDVRPPVALIAGGRPSQARPLEDAGIATYLHVPSPGLLDRFLRDGTRRFVFEGRECGGHVGPRASLPLWEAQIEHLLASDAVGDVDVLFAGGVHDARSGAMVAALAAPLAERGARIGVLMGTAYLFTREVVATGAITPAYQQVARECATTVLLETSPGHATRCVETDYVRAFAARKAELEAAGVPAKDMWAELESLNLGRLRVASKGLERRGAELVEVDETAQRRDGMYMIGQVAAMRDDLTTVAELHEDVSAGGTRRVEALAAERPAAVQVRQPEPTRSLDVAVVGMAALFPDAGDTEQYWANVVAGRDCVTEVPRDRWDPDTYYDPEAVLRDAGRRTPSKWGGFLPWVPFDALRYGIPPRSLGSIESVQLLSLEVVARALADAGYDQREFDRERASVIFGAEGGNDLAGVYGFRAAYPQMLGRLPAALDESLPTPTEDSFPGVLVNVIAGRIANRLDLGGVNYTVDAACAASLAALDTACKELVDGTSDLVLCGAADVHNGINDYLLFASAHALSPTGRCWTFDGEADGITLGEGVACVVLKRLADAERDGDRIYAVIEAVAGSSDGRHLGLTAPRQEGQVRALGRAYRRADVSPSSVGLVEAHGTGTVVGDRTELATLTEVFSAAGAARGAVALGSVKSQVGHTKCAAGLAGLIKAVKAVHAGVLPPTINIRTPNAYYDAETSPFRFLDRPTPWPADERRAAVSAFGFGGTNFHVVLRSHADDDRPRHGVGVWPAELFLVRAESPAAGGERLAELRRVVERVRADDPAGERHRLRDLARTVCESGTGPVRWALVAGDLADLATKIAAAEAGTSAEGVVRERDDLTGGQVAFLYPGQGSQRVGMLGDLFVAFPHLQAVLRHGERWARRIYPGTAFDDAERMAQAEALTDTRAAQPALGLAELALTRLLHDLGVEPDAVGGHSYGELVALATAGALDDAALRELSEARGEAMVAAAAASGGDPGAMAAVSLSADELAPRLPDGVVLANHNGPRQAVISGSTAAVDALVAELTAERVGAKRLEVAAAFHSPLVAGARDALAARLASVAVGTPRLPVWSNATAAPYPTSADEIRALAADQVGRPVRFVEQIEAMYAAGVRLFVEAGPGRVLTQLVGRILGERPHAAVACDAAGEPGLRRLLVALAELAAAGLPVDPRPLFRDRAERLDLPALPIPAPGWRVNGHLVCTRDGEPVPGGLQPATRIPEVTMDDRGPSPTPAPVPAVAATAASAPATGRDAVIAEYLRTGQRLAEAQRDVMLSYLGGAVAAPPSAPDRPPEPLDLPAAQPVRGPAPAPATVEAGTPVGGDGAGGNGAGPGGNGAGGNGASPSAPAARVSRDALLSAILAVVGERTGYPLDMLDPDLDLEADLSIDSIKRIEIVGELADKVGLPGVDPAIGVDETVVEELARLKTLRAIVEWIDEHTAEPAGGANSPAADGPVAGPDGDPATTATGVSPRDEARAPDGPGPDSGRAAPTAPAPSAGYDGGPSASATPSVPPAARRYTVEWAPLTPALPVASLAGQQLAVIAGAWDGLDELRHRLQGAGATIEVLATPADAPASPLPGEMAARLAEVDGVVHLGAVGADTAADARAVFADLRPALSGRATTLVAATAPPSDPPSTAASGVAGLMRTLARELPDRHVRAVELPAAEPAVAARLLADEILDRTGPAAVSYHEGARGTRRVRGGAPVTTEGSALPLDHDSVVVVTGGARGITAGAVAALARATRCRLELVGRSPLPGDEDPRTVAAIDRAALRRTLADQGELRRPAEIEAACDRILAAREIRATLATLRELGSPTEYHQADVREADALTRVLDDVRARHGRIDAVVHGAGVLDDRLARDKTAEGFDRVFGTKVEAARTLLGNLGDDVRLVVFFASVSGVFGNRGQVDYAAANDALDELARRYDGVAGRRVVSIDWGPWAGTGMVSPELEREYARRGVGLVEPDDGVRALLAEMATAPGEPAQVVVMRAEPEALAAGQGDAGQGDAGQGDDGQGDDGRRAGMPPAVALAPAMTPATTPGEGGLTLEALTEHA